MLYSELDRPRRRLWTKAEGPISTLGVRTHLEMEEREGVAGYADLIDARRHEASLTPLLVWPIVEVLYAAGRRAAIGPIAVVVESDQACAVGEMIGTLTDASSGPLRVFRDFEGAWAWLGWVLTPGERRAGKAGYQTGLDPQQPPDAAAAAALPLFEKEILAAEAQARSLAPDASATEQDRLAFTFARLKVQVELGQEAMAYLRWRVERTLRHRRALRDPRERRG